MPNSGLFAEDHDVHNSAWFARDRRKYSPVENTRPNKVLYDGTRVISNGGGFEIIFEVYPGRVGG